MTANRLIACAAALALSVGCGKKDDGVDEESKFLLDSVQKDIGRVKEALAKGEDPKYICAGAGSYAEDLAKKKVKAAEGAVKELFALCGHDVPLAALEASTKKAEEARKAKPDENPLPECFDANHEMAAEDLEKGGYGSDAKVKAITDRWNAVCPPEKNDPM